MWTHRTPSRRGPPDRFACTHCTAHTARHTLHGTRCTAHSVRHTVYGTQCTTHSARHTEHGTQSTAHSARHTVRHTVHGTQCTTHNVRHTVYGIQCTIHSARHTVHGTRTGGCPCGCRTRAPGRRGSCTAPVPCWRSGTDERRAGPGRESCKEMIGGSKEQGG